MTKVSRKKATKAATASPDAPAAAAASGPKMVRPATLGALAALVSIIVVNIWNRAGDSAGNAGDDVAGPLYQADFEPLGSNTSNVWASEQFLSEDEVRYLLDLVETNGGWVPSRTGGTMFETPSQDVFGAAVRTDPVVRRIEERIAEVTGIPIHPHEDLVSVARISTHGHSPRGGHFPPFGLHHDSDTRPARARTLLVYLEVPEDGGRTIFPLLGSKGHAKTGPAELRERHRMFDEAITQHFGGPPEYHRIVSFPSDTDHPFMDLIEESCRGEYGVSFVPAQPGGAVMFESQSQNHESNPLAWHAGCNVVSGRKIILQKFKELPMSQRQDKRHQPDYNPYVTEASSDL